MRIKDVMVVVMVGLLGGSLAVSLFSSGGLDSVCKADCLPDQCQSPPCCNGDVNGDGAIDIADAIYILLHLFKDGQPPAQMHCLQATGQTRCYDTAGNVVACNSEDYPGQDGFYQTGWRQTVRFVDNGDGTITDKCTGLMWQKATPPRTYRWQPALQYCEQLILCEDGTWITDPAAADAHEGAKYNDWRLPNVNELFSLFLYETPMLISPIFGTVPGGSYWSSTTYCQAGCHFAVTCFYSNAISDVIAVEKTGALQIRAVRTISPRE